MVHRMKLSRFTLRDLFWLVLVCALAVGWWVEHLGKLAVLQRSYRMDDAVHELASHLELLQWDAKVNYDTGRVEFKQKGGPE
jgi:hypothetical protein